MGRLLRRIETVVPKRAADYGGKARNLAALSRAGFSVPAAHAMPAQVCERVLSSILPPEDLPAEVVARHAKHGSARLEAIVEKVRRAPLPSDLHDELRTAFLSLQSQGATAVAVRSSSLGEDQSLASAAGLHRSVLGVRTVDALVDAVRECWASLYSPQVVAYLSRQVQRTDLYMGVVVQAMVPAEIGGVLFTANPLTGDTREVVINANYGLPGPVVDGRVSPDTYRYDKASRALRERVLGEKALAVRHVRGRLVEAPTLDSERADFCLDEALQRDLVELGMRLERQFEAPQDVEWAAVDHRIYVLQTRPITTLHPSAYQKSKRGRGDDRARIVWSNVNVGEALPGVATPLTWSVLSTFSELGFRRAFGAIGCRVPKDAELVGNFRGRIYLNLSEFMAIAGQVPGLDPRTLLALGGGPHVPLLEQQRVERGSLWSTGFWSRLPFTASRFVKENYRLKERVREFEAFFVDEKARFEATDLRLLSPQALGQTLRDVERLLDEAGAVLLNCYGNFLASVVALRGVLRLGVGEAEALRLERDLLSGLADLESAAPGLAIGEIARLAAEEPEVRSLLMGTTPPAWDALPDGPTRRALQRFFATYGYRGPREAEIAAPRWGERPERVLDAVRLHLLHADLKGARTIQAQQARVRAQAIREVERALPLGLRLAVRRLIDLTGHFARLREQLRARVTEVLTMFRVVALDVNRRLDAREPEVGSDAAFFLTISELHAVLSGRVRSVVALVRSRRAQFERDRRLPEPPPSFVGYPEALRDAETTVAGVTMGAETSTLTGLSVGDESAGGLDAVVGAGLAISPGHATGQVRVVLGIDEAGALRPGEILVTPFCDVGWVPLFPVVGAIVTELGGLLSHAAIVAREFGTPMVASVPSATSALRTGDWVTVDAVRGEIRRIPSPGQNVSGDGAAEDCAHDLDEGAS